MPAQGSAKFFSLFAPALVITKLNEHNMSHSKFHRTLLAVAVTHTLFLASHAVGQTVISTAGDEATLTEVVVNGNKEVKPISARVGGFNDAPLIDTPLSIKVFDRKLIDDLAIRQTTDAMRFDASVNDAYNAIGYSEQFSIRGFALDNASGYRKDGFAIPGDASIPLENKDRIEILKGIAGFQAGFASPGGIVNYVTKRPTASSIRSLSTGISERGTAFVAADIGGSSESGVFGYRINAADERLRSYVKGANGQREFISGAFDWHLSPTTLLQLDLDYQHKSQLTAPGFQLFDGTTLPTNIAADLFLNDQPWAKPVDTRDSNFGLRVEHQLNADWRVSFAANRHELKRDDYTAFPYGCSSTTGFYPGYCSNGDYDVYDYQSVGESKSILGTQALLSGKFEIGGVRHQVNLGIETSLRKDYFGAYVYDFAGISNIYHPVAVTPSNNVTGAVSLQREDKEFSLFTQDVIDLSTQAQLQVGLRQIHMQREQATSSAYDKTIGLPSIALVFKPQSNWSIYSSYAAGLEHGGVAPFGTSNANSVLNPARSKQIEFGSKADINPSFSITAAIFRIQKPFEYTDSNNTYVSNGNAEHTGLELSAIGKITQDWFIGASLTQLNARQYQTGEVNLEGKRIANVPATKSTIYLDYTACKDLHFNGTWLYSSGKAFSPDNAIAVSGYSVFNAGVRYETQLLGKRATLRFNVDNLTDKFYWRDVTQSLGGYLFPGAPRLYKFSAQFDF